MEGFSVGNSATKEKKEELVIQHKDGTFGYLPFSTDVTIDAEGVITFMKNIDFEGLASLTNESHVRELFDAGILKKGNPDGCKSKYQLAGDEYSGWVILDKDDLNTAVKEGRLKVGLNEEGDISLLE